MDMTAVREGILREEILFPKRFASYEERPYGILYYMDDNHDSYDGNHACIFPDRIRDLGTVLREITAFYREKGIVPSVYHPFVKGYFAENRALIEACGYTYTPEPDHRVMLLTGENTIRPGGSLRCELRSTWDPRVATDILLPSGEPWEIEVTRRRIAQPGSFLFVGYLGERAVVYSDLHVSDEGNTRFDYIVTAARHRGKGYAGELLCAIVEYCKKSGLPNCWQWAGPSEHICFRAGFREAFTMEAGYITGTP